MKEYFAKDDTFNYNFGQVKCQLGLYEEAEELLTNVVSEKMKAEYTYVSHLARTCNAVLLDEAVELV